tara:strand:+ start:177 stop:404 length:228 start_codon:yes stop_codon:yes gene_type:complete
MRCFVEQQEEGGEEKAAAYLTPPMSNMPARSWPFLPPSFLAALICFSVKADIVLFCGGGGKVLQHKKAENQIKWC